jgi:hypothetical protein
MHGVNKKIRSFGQFHFKSFCEQLKKRIALLVFFSWGVPKIAEINLNFLAQVFALLNHGL